jgi:glycyl-tRNA synthetase
VAREVAQELRQYFRIEYDETQSIGRRYRRQDEIGTPYCVTIDYQTLEDRTVTIRDRDTMQQVRVPISGLVEEIEERLRSA